jgi:hypothetical protein
MADVTEIAGLIEPAAAAAGLALVRVKTLALRQARYRGLRNR